MTDRLGHKQTAAMLTLMVLGRAVSNPELHTIVGFSLDGRERVELNELKLVDSRPEGKRRAFVHQLTERGWEWCATELTARTPPPPAPRSTLVAALYLVVEGFEGHLRRERLRLTDVFDTTGPLSADEIEDRIRAHYQELARSPRDWVGLVDLRRRLGGIPGDQVDAVLRELSRTGRAHLVPESNRKALTDADHEAAIRIGGEDNHLISLEVS